MLQEAFEGLFSGAASAATDDSACFDDALLGILTAGASFGSDDTSWLVAVVVVIGAAGLAGLDVDVDADVAAAPDEEAAEWTRRSFSFSSWLYSRYSAFSLFSGRPDITNMRSPVSSCAVLAMLMREPESRRMSLILVPPRPMMQPLHN